MNRRSSLALIQLAAWTIALLPLAAESQTIRLKDGRFLRGKMLRVSGVAENPIFLPGQDAPSKGLPILLVDDDLRRTYVPQFFVADVIDQAPEQLVKIRLWQKVAKQGGAVASVGPSLGITSFDKFGRRIYEMQTRDGPLAVVQGITELTPRYAKVEGLRGQPKSIVWDMRLATSSIPRDTLAEILETAVSRDDPQQWLQVVTFYMQGERYRDARRELELLIRRFPEMKALQAEARQLKRLGARRVLKEIALRRTAGQHKLTSALLANFPAEEVAGETLQQVRQLSAAYEANDARLTRIAERLQAMVAQITDPDHRRLVEPLTAEITRELSHNTLSRLIPFEQLADDPSLAADQKIALAVTGWLLGADGALPKVAVAISLAQVRTTVRKYLNEPLAHERRALLDSMRSLDGASVENVARLIAQMTPPWEIPSDAALGEGAYELAAPGHTENGDFRYLVQLPPEYDPHRRYPTLVVLNGVYNSPLQELEFWTGPLPKDEQGNPTGPRRGQAMRHGYITLAIDWQRPHQHAYQYSLREHEAVLISLRDAIRRFAIDTDRVYLTGHGAGGDATWDLAQAHPDLWAGAIPFVARLDQVNKYIQHYFENAAYVPFYFVAGEKDGRKMSTNALVLDKYFLKRYDVTVVEYLGRGHEPFHDEVLKIFSWMAIPSHRQRTTPKDFACKTLRRWDSYFWWIEGQKFPGTVEPGNWPKQGARPTEVVGRVKDNRLVAKSAAARTTIWLSPDLVDFSRPIRVKLNGKRLTKEYGSAQPDLAVLLEDVRTRGDRQRPFWAKLEMP